MSGSYDEVESLEDEEEEEEEGLLESGIKKNYEEDKSWNEGSRNNRHYMYVMICASIMLVVFVGLLTTKPKRVFSLPQPVSTVNYQLGLEPNKYGEFMQVSLFHGAHDGDYRIGFTILEKGKSKTESCVEPSDVFIIRIFKQDFEMNNFEMNLVASNVGCFVSQDDKREINQFYSATFSVAVDETYVYEIGHRVEAVRSSFQGTFSSKVKKTLIGVLGDTGPNGFSEVVSMFEKYERYSSIIHLGDFSYASNSGMCWANELQIESRCMYNCSADMKCEGRSRQKEENCRKWKSFESRFSSISSNNAVMTTMGNHDNDIQWYLRHFPPFSNSMPNTKQEDSSSEFLKLNGLLSNEMKGAPASKQQAIVNMLLPECIFYSYNVGLVHFVSIQTEDNAINPYERSLDESDSLTKEEELRFNQHFGKDSAQYQWLLKDLESVDKSKTPWIVLFTHRPMFHSSSHHPNCAANSDWYRCYFRHLYHAIYEKYGIHLVLSGHSHHYSRSHPMRLDARNNPISANNSPVYIVNGVGGMDIDEGFGPQPEWVAFRSDEYYGFGTLMVHNETHMQWDFVDAATGKTMDTATISNY